MTINDSILRNMISISQKNQLHEILTGKKHLVIGLNHLNEICETYNILGLLTCSEREALADFFRQIRLLCLFNDLRYHRSDFYSIGMFVNVHSLEFVKVDISTIGGFDLIQPRIRFLSLDKCSHSLSTFIKAYTWTQLEELSITHSNDLNILSCIKPLRGLRRLKLEFCSLSIIGDHLTNLTRLEVLSLSFNKLETIPHLSDGISVLNLRGNCLRTLAGVGKLSWLLSLDVSLNNIEVPKAVEDVSHLENLRRFDYSENPLSFVPKIRPIVMKCLFWRRDVPRGFVLNGKVLTKADKISLTTCDYQLHTEASRRTITLNLSDNFRNLGFLETIQEEIQKVSQEKTSSQDRGAKGVLLENFPTQEGLKEVPLDSLPTQEGPKEVPIDSFHTQEGPKEVPIDSFPMPEGLKEVLIDSFFLPQGPNEVPKENAPSQEESKEEVVESFPPQESTKNVSTESSPSQKGTKIEIASDLISEDMSTTLSMKVF